MNDSELHGGDEALWTHQVVTDTRGSELEVGGGREAVEEEGGIALACFELVEGEAVDLDVVARGLGHRAMMPASRASVTGRYRS
ncbi:MAG: hypothetical protein WBM75_14480 [Polyangiales bacterium]